MRSRYHPEMTSCPLYCIFEMGIRSGHHVVRFLWPWSGQWPHHGSPLLRVRGQQGMRAATRMTLARALQLVSTSLGPWAAGTTVPALVRTVLLRLEDVPSRDAALFLLASSQVYGQGEIVSIPAWRVASRIGSWEMVIVGKEPKVETMRSGTSRPESGSRLTILGGQASLA